MKRLSDMARLYLMDQKLPASAIRSTGAFTIDMQMPHVKVDLPADAFTGHRFLFFPPNKGTWFYVWNILSQ